MNKYLGQYKGWRFNLIVRLGSFWVGCHYSPRYEAYCIALVPMVVLRVGKSAYLPDDKIDCKH